MADPQISAPPVAVGALELIQVRSADPVATAEWYRDVLGAKVQMTSPYWSRVRLGNVDIGIHEGALPDGPGWEPGFRVHDIAAARASLVANGVEVTQEFHDIPGGVKLAFADPSGNVLGLLQYGIAVADLEA